MQFCLISLVLGILSTSVLSATDSGSYSVRGYDVRVQYGIDLIYSLQFEKADAHFEKVIASNPDLPLGYFFKAMVAWWRVLIDLDDSSNDEAFYDALQRCIDVCDERLMSDPLDFDSILFKGGAIGFRGRLRGDRGQYLSAARDGLRALPLLNKSRQLEPANKDILFGQGLYNYFADVMPERHAILRPFMVFLPDGDRELGLSQLKQAAEEGIYASAEASYFLAQIYRVFEDQENLSLPYLEKLFDSYPDNALFHRYIARNLVDVGRWQEGSVLYRDYIDRTLAGRRGYHIHGLIESHYYLGRLAYLRNDWEVVREHLVEVDSLLPVSYRVRDAAHASLANLYLGIMADRNGDVEEAHKRYQRVLILPPYSDCHERARLYMKKGFNSISN